MCSVMVLRRVTSILEKSATEKREICNSFYRGEKRHGEEEVEEYNQ